MNQTVKKPTRTLGDKPEINSEQELSLAMHELCWLNSVQAAELARCNAEIAELKAASEKRLKTRGVSFADRVKSITDAIVDFATGSARDSLLSGKGKTAKLTHGEIKFQDQKARLAVVSQKKQDVTGEQLSEALTRSLARQQVGDSKATALYDVKVTLNKTRGYESVKSGDVSTETLKQLGLKVEKPDEKVAVKPFNYTVESPSEAA